MRNKNKQIDFLNLSTQMAGGLGVFALLACATGFFKFYMLYQSLGCEWAISFHNFQDFVFKGSMDVAIVFLVGSVFFFSFESSVDLDYNGRRIVGWILLGVAIFVGVSKFLGVSLSYIVTDYVVYSVSCSLFGVWAAALIKESIREKTYKYVPAIIGVYLVCSVGSAYHVLGGENFSTLKMNSRFPYAISDDGKAALLISAVSGRYLLRICGSENNYKISSNTDAWEVSRSDNGLCVVN